MRRKRSPFNKMYSNPSKRINWQLTLVVLLIVGIIGSFSKCNAQCMQFEFEAHLNRSVSVGSQADFEKTEMSNPVTVKLNNSILSIVKNNGNKWMEDVKVIRCIPVKKLSNGKVIAYYLEYNDNGMVTYATYQKIQGTDGDQESITIPILIERAEYVFSYTTMSKQ